MSGDVGADDFPEKVVGTTVKKYGKINHIVNNGDLFYHLHLPIVIANPYIGQLGSPTTAYVGWRAIPIPEMLTPSFLDDAYTTR